jgi:hypothetical protein
MQFRHAAGFGNKNHSSRSGINCVTQLGHVAVLATTMRVAFQLGSREESEYSHTYWDAISRYSRTPGKWAFIFLMIIIGIFIT